MRARAWIVRRSSLNIRLPNCALAYAFKSALGALEPAPPPTSTPSRGHSFEQGVLQQDFGTIFSVDASAGVSFVPVKHAVCRGEQRAWSRDEHRTAAPHNRFVVRYNPTDIPTREPNFSDRQHPAVGNRE